MISYREEIIKVYKTDEKIDAQYYDVFEKIPKVYKSRVPGNVYYGGSYREVVPSIFKYSSFDSIAKNSNIFDRGFVEILIMQTIIFLLTIIIASGLFVVYIKIKKTKN
jgi:hypothetical protein